MEKIKLLHRLNDPVVNELREYVAMLAYAYDQAMAKERFNMELEFKPIILLSIMVMIELGEWGSDLPSPSEMLDEYQDRIVSAIGNRITPEIRDCLDRVVGQLEDMLETGWSPVERGEVDRMVDGLVPVSEDKTYTVIKYEVSISPITFILRIEPTLLEEDVQKH